MNVVRGLPTAAKIVAAAWLAMFGVAGGLALAGDGEAAIKLALFAGLLPGVLLFGAWAVSGIRDPGSLRDPRVAGGTIFAIGIAVWGVALLIWLPFSPWQWGINEMPLVLRLPFVGGLVLVGIGAVPLLIGQARDFWRRRDYLRALLTVGALVFMAVTVIALQARR